MFTDQLHSPSLQHTDKPPLLALEGLAYAYPNGNKALRSIHLNVYPRDRIALIGRNGSGKSTLIRHFNGLLPLQQGSLFFEGQSFKEYNLHHLRMRMGVLFQDPDNHLFCTTVGEDVAFGPLNQGKNPQEVERLVTESLARVGLEQHRHKPAHLLSYGQRKRAAFAAVLAMEPEILILDEPTAGLDPRQEKVFTRILREYSGTLIIIDHDLLFLYSVCTRALVMNQGKIEHDCPLAELVSQPQHLRAHGLDFTFRFTCCGHHPPESHHHHHHTHTHDHATKGRHLPSPAQEAKPILELQHYTFAYPDASPGVIDINLCIREGETLALVGENGAGKSTLAHCLLGLHQGEGYLFFRDALLSPPAHKRLGRHIGMVFQHTADQLFCPSCWEEVAFGPRQMQLPPETVAQRVQVALSAMHLEAYADRVPLHLSGGERKRLAIAAVLAMEPEILILDEPTISLDPSSERLLMALLDRLTITKVIITHDLFFIHELTTRTVVMHQGRIVRDYPTHEFIADDRLQAVNGLDYTYKNACSQEIQGLQPSVTAEKS